MQTELVDYTENIKDIVQLAHESQVIATHLHIGDLEQL